MIHPVLSGLDGDTIWAIEPNAYAALLAQAKAVDLSSVRPAATGGVAQDLAPIHRMAGGASGQMSGVSGEMSGVSGVSGGSGGSGGVVGVIDISGPMVKRPSLLTALFNATSTESVRRAVDAAAANDDLDAILLRIDSPGGSVGGLAELADSVFAARQSKPVVAQVMGMAASAALLVASQADKIFAQRMDLVGSIGTRMTVMDTSRFFANLGIEMIHIDTGEFKSAGAPGTVVTDRQRDKFREMVTAFFDDFIGSIVRGRSMSQDSVRKLADGGLFMASEAVSVGLIDGVQTFEQTLDQLAQRRSVKNQPKRSVGQSGPTTHQLQEPTMSEPTDPKSNQSEPIKPTEPSPESGSATYKQIKDACPGADAQFICDQQERNATIDQARTAWMTTQQARLEAREAELAKAKQAAARPGVDALVERGGGQRASNDTSGDPQSAFNAAVQAKVDAGMSKIKATSAVIREDPDLHAAYLESYNQDHPPVSDLRKKLITRGGRI